MHARRAVLLHHIGVACVACCDKVPSRRRAVRRRTLLRQPGTMMSFPMRRGLSLDVGSTRYKARPRAVEAGVTPATGGGGGGGGGDAVSTPAGLDGAHDAGVTTVYDLLDQEAGVRASVAPSRGAELASFAVRAGGRGEGACAAARLTPHGAVPQRRG